MTDEIKTKTPKYRRRAKAILDQRIASYQETCRTRSDNGRGFRRPGSMKLKK